MDLTTLLTAVLLAVGLLGADAVVNAGMVEVQVDPPPKIESLSMDKNTLDSEFEAILNDIAETQSVVKPPEIRSTSEEGVGMALADAANVKNVAFALQNQMGFNPDRLRLSLYAEDGKLRALVTGSSHSSKNFRNILTPNPGEPLPDFIHRCALWGVSQLAPYSTTLWLIEQHAADGDFTDALALIDHAEALLPNTPMSFDRSLFENVRGLIALFKNDKQAARQAFDASMKADPANSVAFLNAAFTDLEFDENDLAARRMEQLVRLAPPKSKVLLATAYTTWAAALMGKKDWQGADRLFAISSRINPESSTTWHLWSENKESAGDTTAAKQFMLRAQEASATFENYAEVASLYFRLSWGAGGPVTRSQFANPKVVTFH